MSLPIITGIADECEKKPEVKRTPMVVNRIGTFLYELDDGARDGQRINLWSGKLEANNGHSPEHAERAAMLFVAAHDLLGAARQASFALRELLPDHPDAQMTVRMLEDAIAKATGSAQ